MDSLSSKIIYCIAFLAIHHKSDPKIDMLQNVFNTGKTNDKGRYGWGAFSHWKFFLPSTFPLESPSKNKQKAIPQKKGILLHKVLILPSLKNNLPSFAPASRPPHPPGVGVCNRKPVCNEINF